LRQAPVQRREIDAVHLLILVEAGKDNSLSAGLGVALQLQSLRADLFHHALHRRVDRGDRPVIRPEIVLETCPVRLGDRVHHAIGAGRDDASTWPSGISAGSSLPEPCASIA
jgi:hypothetical protein